MIGTLEALGGVALIILAGLVSVIVGVLLFITPLMIWLNLRRMRLDLHADMLALRASLERAGQQQPPEPPAVSADVETSAQSAPQGAAAAGMIGFSCPGCGKFFEGPASLAGTDHTCPECRVSFHIH